MRRSIAPQGLRAEKIEGAGSALFRVRLAGVRAEAEEWFRGKGPWYRDEREFPCDEEESWFATEAGSRVAAAFASGAWLRGADLRFHALLHSLSLVRGASGEEALREAGARLEAWVRGLEREWREDLLPRARAEEWAFYRKSHGGPECKRPVGSPSWDALRERPPAAGSAPAWRSLTAVRVRGRAAVREGRGLYLLDPGADPHLRAEAGAEGAGSETVPYGWAEGRGRARVSRSPLSWAGEGLWAVAPLGFSSPLPDLIPCCDGVIGRELFRARVIEWDPTRSEIRVAPPKGFASPRGWKSTEAILDRDGKVALPACALKGAEGKEWRGAVFDPGAAGFLHLHPALRRELASVGSRGTVDCGGGLSPFVEFPIQVGSGAGRDGGAPAPAFRIGGQALYARAWILDLPHGWIHFPPGSVSDPGSAHPDSPLLVTEFREVAGKRRLFVAAVPSRAPEALRRIVVGSEITALQGKDPVALSQFDVEAVLRGERGSEIALRVRGARSADPERSIRFALP